MSAAAAMRLTQIHPENWPQVTFQGIDYPDACAVA